MRPNKIYLLLSFLIGLLHFCGPAIHAADMGEVLANRPKRLPLTLNSIELKVRRRGQLTTLELKNQKGQYLLTGRKNTAPQAVRREDLEELKASFDELPTVERIPKKCDRARVDITVKDAGHVTHKASCLGVRSITTPAYTRFVERVENLDSP